MQTEVQHKQGWQDFAEIRSNQNIHLQWVEYTEIIYSKTIPYENLHHVLHNFISFTMWETLHIKKSY